MSDIFEPLTFRDPLKNTLPRLDVPLMTQTSLKSLVRESEHISKRKQMTNGCFKALSDKMSFGVHSDSLLEETLEKFKSIQTTLQSQRHKKLFVTEFEKKRKEEAKALQRFKKDEAMNCMDDPRAQECLPGVKLKKEPPIGNPFREKRRTEKDSLHYLDAVQLFKVGQIDLASLEASFIEKERRGAAPTETLKGIDREEYVPLAGKYVSPGQIAREKR